VAFHIAILYDVYLPDAVVKRAH